MLIKDARKFLEIEERWKSIPKTRQVFFNRETGEAVTGRAWALRLKRARQVMEDYAAQVEIDFGPDTPIPLSPTTDQDDGDSGQSDEPANNEDYSYGDLNWRTDG